MDYLFQFEPRSVSPNPMSDALADLQASIEEQYMALGGMLLIYPNFYDESADTTPESSPEQATIPLPPLPLPPLPCDQISSTEESSHLPSPPPDLTGDAGRRPKATTLNGGPDRRAKRITRRTRSAVPKKPQFPCNLDGCKQVCSSTGDLNRHRESLAHKAPCYKCYGCERSFTRIDALKRHQLGKPKCKRAHLAKLRATEGDRDGT